MFSFFKRKNLVTDIAWLGVDIHSHILPGIDDGAKDIEQSLRYIKTLNELGFSHSIATPHIFKELYPNSYDTIRPVLELVQKELSVLNLSITIDSAAEYMLDEDFDITDRLCRLNNNHLLIEMSYLNETPNIDQMIFDLQVKGIKPILAHPERYIFYFKNPSRIKKFKQSGCMLQLNLLSILGYYGKEVKLLAEYLLKENLYDFAGTDLHHDRHLKLLKQGVENGTLYKFLGQYPFKNKEVFQ